MSIDTHDRNRLAQLADVLRDVAIEALQRRSALARALDESRLEVERLLMLSNYDPNECRRVVIRAQMILNVWHGTAAAAAASRIG